MYEESKKENAWEPLKEIVAFRTDPICKVWLFRVSSVELPSSRILEETDHLRTLKENNSSIYNSYKFRFSADMNFPRLLNLKKLTYRILIPRFLKLFFEL